MDSRAMRSYWFSTLLMLSILVLGACGSDTSNFPSEGSVAEPIDVGPAPTTFSGTVGKGGDSYFSSAAETGDWQVTISNIDGKPDLFLYRDAAYSDSVCDSELVDAQPDSCPVSCTGACDIYIRVSGAADSGASFNLSIIEQTEAVPLNR